MDGSWNGPGMALLCARQPWPQLAHLEEALVILPGHSSQMFQQGALMREGKMERQVASVFSVAHLPQVVACAALGQIVLGACYLLGHLDACMLQHEQLAGGMSIA